MVIATFTSGKYTLIGLKSNGEQAFKSIDSKYLYQDSHKFVGRYLNALNNLFDIKKLNEDDQIIFAISGNIDETKNKIIESKLLNDISISSYFNGFNFTEAFSFLVRDKNISLISDSRAVTYGALMNANFKSNEPSLCLSIDSSISLMLIKGGVMISYDDVLKTPRDKSSMDLIGDRGIDDILNRYDDNISFEYSQNLSKIISNILSASKDDEIDCKNIFIHSNKIEFIEKKTIEKSFPALNFYITDGLDKDKYLPLVGSFIYSNLIKLIIKAERNGISFGLRLSPLAFKKIIFPLAFIPPFDFISYPRAIYRAYRITEIIKIDFYSDKGEKKSTINSFEELKSHWIKTKPLLHGNSYYIIRYQNKTNIKVYLENLNSITDLQRYKF